MLGKSKIVGAADFTLIIDLPPGSYTDFTKVRKYSEAGYEAVMRNAEKLLALFDES